MPTVATVADSGINELAAATRTLVRAVDRIESDMTRQPSVEVLAQAVCGCMRQAGLLAALAGSLQAMAADAARSARLVAIGPRGTAMSEIALDLASMRSLLRRATLVAAPALADLQHATCACSDQMTW